MAKLTEKQIRVLQYLDRANRMVSMSMLREVFPRVLQTVYALAERKLIATIDDEEFGMTEEVGINDAGRAAIAQTAAAPTVNAEPWTPAVDLSLDREQLSRDTADVLPMPAEFSRWVEPAVSADTVNAAGVGEVADEMERFFTMSDAQKFSELINQADVIRKNDAQIAALTRNLADAVAERDALREAFERNEKQLAIGQQVKDERLSDLMDETDKLVAALESISPMEGLTRLLSFRRFYNEFVQELHRAEARTDAAMVAALRSRDNGNRVSVDDVESALEAQWADEEAQS